VSAGIPLERAHRVVRLLGEVREIGAGTEAARAHVATSLLDFLGADIGGAVLDTAHHPGGKKGVRGFTAVNLTREVQSFCEVLEADGCAAHPLHRAMMDARSERTVCVATDALVPRNEWLSSPFVHDWLRPARIDRYVASVRYLAAGTVDTMGFYRASGSRPFTEQDRIVLELVHAGLPPLFDPNRVALPPRAEQAIHVLATGASDKEIASALGISYHTAREYVRMALRAYGVTSRTQLIAKLTSSR
jgi:DNA-binding CsgD family transcriptional regulator